MDKKQKPLAAVWNQVDSPPARRTSGSSASAQPDISGLDRKKPKTVNQAADQNAAEKCRSDISLESVKGAGARSSNSNRSRGRTDECRSLTAQKRHGARQSTFPRPGRNAHVENTKAGNNHSASSGSSHAVPVPYKTSRNKTRNENDFVANRFSTQVDRSRSSSTQRGNKDNSRSGKHSKNQVRHEDNQNQDKNNERFSNRQVKPISFFGLKELVTKDPNEILLKICVKNSPYKLLMGKDTISPDMMALILIALGKVCSSDLKQTLGTFLNFVKSKTDFLLISIQTFLVTLRPDSMQDYHLESLSYLLIFLQKFQQTLPSSASNIISILLPLLTQKYETFLSSSPFYGDVMNKLKDIEDQNEHFLKQHTGPEIQKQSKKETLQLSEPPENFRALSILPNSDDIYSNAFLRPNIVEGKYFDTEHYLDVQYRLLREDYVKPLRDGIGEYLRLKEGGKSVMQCRDARVYENVHIVKQEFVNGSMLHIVQFSDERFARMKWEYSKRFLSGSLLCLSSDNFKTMLFASVARRVPEQLKKGLLLIRFEQITEEVLNISPLRSFVIIETTAYFEAYRYNLRALHELNEETLPLKDYIINVEAEVDHPCYLKPSTTYDMRPLFLPLNSTYITRKLSAEGEMSYQYDFPADLSGVGSFVQVLSDRSWPSASDLNLDNSQYLALKAAVTKEFAIIQGPPGTGKTYIGLRIVQLLLHNIGKWFRAGSELNSLPILVVCFTNHALDQFLEGMMGFTDKIVRIGGRGLNEAVAKFQLTNLKKLAIQKKEFPRHIPHALFLQNQEIRSLKADIDLTSSLMVKCVQSVLGERELRDYMPDVHYQTLKGILKAPEYQEFHLTDDGCIIHDWLGVRSRSGWGEFLLQEAPETKVEVRNEVMHPEPMVEELDDEVESVGEGDVEFIEAQRDIDTEDFADVSFDIENIVKEEFLPSDDDGWQYQGGKKQKAKHIRRWLNSSKALEETEALRISNVWCLPMPTRWSLYKYWLEKMISSKQEECLLLQSQLKELYEEMCETRTEEDMYILMQAHVVGMTTTGAAKYRHLVQRLNPQILIVEEAAEILESHIVTSLAPNTQHVILIGDHQQLRPSPTVHMLAVKYDLNISLFERMIKNKMDCFKLSIQHRMRPDIRDLIVPHIYEELENHESVTKYENIKGVGKNIFFINHDYNELQESDSKSKSNEHEAKFLVKLCNYFIQQGYESSQITVLTTYTGQLFAMKRIARTVKMIQNVRFTVVDNYQGEENDIILISFVRSNEEGEIGFLKVANRVCVALSRARKGLYCIGNFELLEEKSELWKNITGTLKEKKAIGQSLQLLCQNHPDVYNEVSNEKDFESVPEGGCTKVCEYRLSCGHVCSLVCHPYDQSHSNVRCFKKCTKMCEEGHECPRKCYEECGPCTVKISRKIFPCGHTVKVPCSKRDEEIICNAKCDENLICGHRCPNKCSEVCAELCKKVVSIKSPICGHVVQVECCYKDRPEELIRNCRQACDVVLECGHKCSGNCKNCHQGRLHVACNKPCKRILVCGHECKSPCAKSCPPCKLPCENRCIHSKCPRECGEPCDVCTEKCGWQCKHKKCPSLCGETCSRVPCNQPCSVLLPCGHPCIGFCGEPCPKECRVCDSEVVKEIFFGTEEDDDARFVCLEDCNHILEISGLNEWMRVEEEGNHQVQMKACPKCKTVIRTNLRFGNVVKDCLKKIEKVKRKTFGNVEKNKRLQRSLLKFVETKPVLLELKSDLGSLYEFWGKILAAKRCRSIQEITTMENIVKIAFQLAGMGYEGVSLADRNLAAKEGISVLSQFVESSKIWLIEFMHHETFTASEQQLQQLSWEVHRLELCYKFLNFTRGRYVKMPNPDFDKCVSVLTNYRPFEESCVKQFSDSFNALLKSSGSADINVSEMEKKSILTAMNLTAGHWYQCPNGHVYCITECGGAMQEGVCNECNAKIGGTHHTLLSTNRVATDMDGARYSAWSDQANLGNYDLALLDD